MRLGNCLRFGITVKATSLQVKVETESSSTCLAQVHPPMVQIAGTMEATRGSRTNRTANKDRTVTLLAPPFLKRALDIFSWSFEVGLPRKEGLLREVTE